MSMDYYESFFEGYVATLGMGSYIFSFAVYEAGGGIKYGGKQKI